MQSKNGEMQKYISLQNQKIKISHVYYSISCYGYFNLCFDKWERYRNDVDYLWYMYLHQKKMHILSIDFVNLP